MDSFDHYATADLTAKWTGFGASSLDFLIDTANARTGRACGQILRNGIFKTIDRQQTWIAGAAVKFEGLGSGGFLFLDVGTVQVQLVSQGDGTFAVYRGTAGGAVLLGQSDPSDAISANRYFYLECKVIIDSSAGYIEVRLNGQVILKLTGVNTKVTANSTADVFALHGPGGGTKLWVDDLYVNDANGGINDDFWGDTQIGLLIPTSDGDFSGFTPSTGSAHFSLVNEIPPDGDATYVSANAPNSPPNPFPTIIDTYNFQQVDPTRPIKAIQTNVLARKDDEGNRALSVVTRQSGNNFIADPTGRFINLTYIDYLNQFDTNPSTGLAWTPAQINAGQWGVKLIA